MKDMKKENKSGSSGSTCNENASSIFRKNFHSLAEYTCDKKRIKENLFQTFNAVCFLYHNRNSKQNEV
jgi:hypothetical protein